jgi:hypothetical protein
MTDIFGAIADVCIVISVMWLLYNTNSLDKRLRKLDWEVNGYRP